MSLFDTAARKEYPVEFNAGKCFLGGNIVSPDLRKGKIYMDQSDDQLLHFYWKERDGPIEDDIVILPSDASFTRVPQCTTGRVYLLRLDHSDEKHFYWMQSKNEEKDQEIVNSVNALLGEQDIDMSTELDENASHTEIMRLLSGVENQDPSITEENILEFLQSMSRSREKKSRTEEVKRQQESQENYEQLAQMLTPQSGTQTSGQTSEQTSGQTSEQADEQQQQQQQQLDRPIALTDVLNTSSIMPLLNDPAVCESLYSHLPEEFEHSKDQLRHVVSSPQFSQSLQSFTVALETGQLGPLLSQLGLDATGYGVESFLNAIERQAQEKKKDTMEE